MPKTIAKKRKQSARAHAKSSPKKAAGPVANGAMRPAFAAAQKAATKPKVVPARASGPSMAAQVLVFLFTMLCVLFAAKAFYNHF